MRPHFLACAMVVLPIVAHAATPNLSAFPKLPHVVRDACWIENKLYFITESGVFQATPGDKAWEIRSLAKNGTGEVLWSITCGDLLPNPGVELVVSRVRKGVWRSFVLALAGSTLAGSTPDGTDWKRVLDDLPFALRQTRWQGTETWIGDARLPQDRGRGEFFLINASDGRLKLGKRIRLPHGSALDNWVELPGGDIAELRERRLEIYTDGPKWKMKQHLPGGGATTLCAESQPPILSGTGEIFCRQMAPSVWNTLLLTPHNTPLADRMVGRVPMIEHGELISYIRDPALDLYQTAVVQGPLAGELAAYFIDKNPMDGGMTLFLVVQMRTAAEAVGGLTKYSLLVPIALDTVQASQ